MRRLALSLIAAVVMLAGAPPVTALADDPPEISVVDVRRGDGIEIVFIGDGDVPTMGGQINVEDRRAFLTEEMKNVMAFFGDRYGFTATSVQVLVFLDYRVGGGRAGGDWFYMDFGPGMDAEDARSLLAHEYFHVLQSQAFIGAGGDYAVGTPLWIVEGGAAYAQALFTHTGSDADRRSDLIANALQDVSLREAMDRGIGNAGYSIGALAFDWLAEYVGEDKNLEFWRQLAASESVYGWSDAFTATFGMTPENFFTRFEAYWDGVLLSTVPHRVDDIIAPVVITTGEVPATFEAAVRAEAEQVRAFFVDRLGAPPVDYTIHIQDGPTWDARVGHYGREEYWSLFADLEPPPCADNGSFGLNVQWMNASCSWESNIRPTFYHFHGSFAEKAITNGRKRGEPDWLGSGIDGYIDNAYAVLTGRHHEHKYEVEDLRSSTRSLGPLRTMQFGEASALDIRHLGTLAVDRLVERAGEKALFDFYRELHAPAPSWQSAFETAFGLTPEAFHEEFERYRATLR